MKSTDTRQVEKERKPVHRLTPFTLAALGSQKLISKIRSLLSLERANQAARACNTEGFLSGSFRVPFRAEVISRHGSKLFPFWKMLEPVKTFVIIYAFLDTLFELLKCRTVRSCAIPKTEIFSSVLYIVPNSFGVSGFHFCFAI